MKVTFRIEAAKIETDQLGHESSGETIYWATAKTEKSAKKKGLSFLKKKNVYSVWIHKHEEGNDGDPLYQWSIYKGDTKWNGGAHW